MSVFKVFSLSECKMMAKII